MAYYGYHRVSTKEQHLDRGITHIQSFCKERGIELSEIFTDKSTGTNFDRPDYKILRRIIKKGDTVIFTEIDRIGRSKSEIIQELNDFERLGVRIMILEVPTTLIDASTLQDELAKMILETINRTLIDVYSAMSEAEMKKREKRQREGIESMKIRGDWDKYGRPHIINQDKFNEVYDKVLSGKIRPTECMKTLGMKTSTYYRYKSNRDKQLADK